MVHLAHTWRSLKSGTGPIPAAWTRHGPAFSTAWVWDDLLCSALLCSTPSSLLSCPVTLLHSLSWRFHHLTGQLRREDRHMVTRNASTAASTDLCVPHTFLAICRARGGARGSGRGVPCIRAGQQGVPPVSSGSLQPDHPGEPAPAAACPRIPGISLTSCHILDLTAFQVYTDCWHSPPHNCSHFLAQRRTCYTCQFPRHPLPSINST